MTTKEIQLEIARWQVEKGHSPVVENLSFYTSGLPTFEMDIMSLSKAGLMYEFEVKISRADYKQDSEKQKKHTLLAMGCGSMPNYFNYVCPEGLIKGHQIPKYAGLIYLVNGKPVEVVRAPQLHSSKHNLISVLEKVCRVQSERLYLGGCKMTVKNNSVKEHNKKLLQGLGFEGELLKNSLKQKR